MIIKDINRNDILKEREKKMILHKKINCILNIKIVSVVKDLFINEIEKFFKDQVNVILKSKMIVMNWKINLMLIFFFF